jgi:hypothetical protein
VSNPFFITNPNEASRQGALDLQEAIAEKFLSEGGERVDLPSTPGELSFGKKLLAGFARQALPGLELYGPPESTSRIDYNTLDEEQRARFDKFPMLQRVLLLSKNPGGIVEIAQNDELWQQLTVEEPTVFQEYMGAIELLGKNAPGSVKSEMYGHAFDLMAAGGIGSVSPDQAARARKLMELGNLEPSEERDLAMGMASPSINADPIIKQLEERLATRRKKEAADITQSEASAFASRASGGSSLESARVSRRGKLYRFGDGQTMYDSAPEFQARLARGDTPLLVSSASGTEAGASSVISKSDRSNQAIMYQGAADAKVRLERVISVMNDPNVSVTGLAGLAREFGPKAATLPGVSAALKKGTGLSPQELQTLQTELSLLQFQLVDPIVREERKTDEERRAAGVITQPGVVDTAEVIQGRNAAIYHMLNLNADKNLYSATGRFTYDVTNPDAHVSLAEAARLQNDLIARGRLTPVQAQDAYAAFARNQEMLRQLGPEQVKTKYASDPRERLGGPAQ